MKTLFQATIYVVTDQTQQQEHIFQWLYEFDPIASYQCTWLNEAGESISIETIRELQSTLAYGQDATQKRFIIILNAHQLTLPAQQSCLKLLEEPSPNTYFILATSQPEKLLPTIHSRCYFFYHSSVDTGELKYESHQQLLTELSSMSYGQLVQQSESISTKDDGVTFLTEIILFLHQNIVLNKESDIKDSKCILNSSFISKSILILQKHLKTLQENSNVKLTITECLFSLKKALASTQS